jgi:putative two-component system response regulator
LKASEIPVAGRIVAIADAFDAMTNNRPYRAGREVGVALSVIRSDANRHFEPRLVEALDRIINVESAYGEFSNVVASCA